MKAILLTLTLGVLTFASCNKCKDQDPTARVINNGSESVDVHIKTSGGNTVNINNIEGGTASDFRSYAPGLVNFRITVSNGGSTAEYNSTVVMDDCFQYDVILDQDNLIRTVSTDLNE